MKNEIPPPPSEKLIPEYIRLLQTYQAGRPIEEVARETGLTKISKLASNENPLGPSPLALEKIQNWLKEIHRYPDMHAYELKTALAEKYRLKKDNIILGDGSEGIMSYIVRTFLGPGEEVLTSENTFIGFYILARAVGANLKCIPLNNKYQFDVEVLSTSIGPKTKIIYIANPNNPTGTYITKKEFDHLMDHVPPHILVILDEAYFEFAREYNDFPDSMDYRYNNVITLRTFSKAYGLAGIRIGYGFAHEELISNLHKVKLPFAPSSLAQKAAVAALSDSDHLEKTLNNNRIEKKKLELFLNKKNQNQIPSVCNFITVKTQESKKSDLITEQLLKQGVIIRHLRANEMPNFIRISIGTTNEMEHLYNAWEQLKL